MKRKRDSNAMGKPTKKYQKRFAKGGAAKKDLGTEVIRVLQTYRDPLYAALQVTNHQSETVADMLNKAIKRKDGENTRSFVRTDGNIVYTNENEPHDYKKEANHKCVASTVDGSHLGSYSSSCHAEMNLIQQNNSVKRLYCNMGPCSSCRVSLLLMGVKSSYIKNYDEGGITQSTDWTPPLALKNGAAKAKMQSLLEEAVEKLRKKIGYVDFDVGFEFSDCAVVVGGTTTVIKVQQTKTDFIIFYIKRLRGHLW